MQLAPMGSLWWKNSLVLPVLRKTLCHFRTCKENNICLFIHQKILTDSGGKVPRGLFHYIRGGPFDFWWGGCANPQKNIEQPYKPGRGKGFCVMRDGPKSSRESHATGLGITFFDAWIGILQARRMIYQLDFLLKWTLWSRRILWFKDIHAFRFPP